jgi:hypothetical protein
VDSRDGNRSLQAVGDHKVPNQGKDSQSQAIIVGPVGIMYGGLGFEVKAPDDSEMAWGPGKAVGHQAFSVSWLTIESRRVADRTVQSRWRYSIRLDERVPSSPPSPGRLC